MTFKGIMAAAAVVVASLVAVGVTQPAFAAAGGLEGEHTLPSIFNL